MIIRIDNSQASTRLDLWGGTSGVFTGIDRFGRVVDQRWQNNTGGTPSDIDRYQYGYDRDSNRTWKQNTTATGLDEFYAYDALNRLTQMQRGTLNGTKTGITGTPAAEQDWGLDPLGNWGTFQTKASGTTNLSQTRTANQANEITAIAGTPAWATPPAYDPAGNMTSFPQPAAPADAFGAVYDAWNRLVKMTDASGTVSTYQYDGQGRRITKTTASETRHYYYTSQWQDVEERVGTSTTADVQYVWGLRYVDELICRDDPTNGRLFARQDANFNLTAITDTSGVVQERYNYTPYGVRTVLSASWTGQTDQFGFLYGHQSGRTDPATGLIHFRARDYNPTLGTWMQQDPIGYVDGMSLYQFVGGNPINRSDPAGLSFSFSPPTFTSGSGNTHYFSSSVKLDVLGFDLFDASWKGDVSWGASHVNLSAAQCTNGGFSARPWSVSATVSAYPLGAITVASGNTKNVQGGGSIGIYLGLWAVEASAGFFLQLEWYSWSPKCGCTQLHAGAHVHGSEYIGLGAGLELALAPQGPVMQALKSAEAAAVGGAYFLLKQALKDAPDMPRVPAF